MAKTSKARTRWSADRFLDELCCTGRLQRWHIRSTSSEPGFPGSNPSSLKKGHTGYSAKLNEFTVLPVQGQYLREFQEMSISGFSLNLFCIHLV
jgi:hypothetical protein